tara:strand:- start:2385 stop:3116 length:732 start_codon:yes stop_codon:yes gene_type:complete
MNKFNLDTYSYSELKQLAMDMSIKIRRSKTELIKDITTAFKEYEDYKRRKIDKYKKIGQLGEKGKEGITYLVQSKDQEYAMKTFRKMKSSKTLQKEAELQNMAAEVGVSPKVIDVDTVSKYIVMEKLDRHLYEYLMKNNGVLSKNLQKQIVSIYRKLDKAGVFHADANLLNYMFKGKKLYIIDFGMAKEITNSLIYKLGTNTPNLSIMTLGFILKLKELKTPPSSYSHLVTYLSDEQRSQFNL